MLLTAHLGQKGIAIPLEIYKKNMRESKSFEFVDFIALSSAEQYIVTL